MNVSALSDAEQVVPGEPGGADGWRGVFAILTTPFNDDGSLDLDSLWTQTEYCVAAGAHGIVTPVNASESWTLSDDERRLVVETTIATVAGAAPVIIGVGGSSAIPAVSLAKHAQDVGADGVISMPPGGDGLKADAVFKFYSALSDAVSLPIFVQNYHTPATAQMRPEFVARLVREIPNVRYIKEESNGAAHAISEELRLSGPSLLGVMGGLAARNLLDEYHRGSCGTMPACEAVDVHVAVWNMLESGDEASARQLFNRLLPLLNYQAMTPGGYKAVLQRRGILKTGYMRTYAGSPLDVADERELDRILSAMSDLFTLMPPA